MNGLNMKRIGAGAVATAIAAVSLVGCGYPNAEEKARDAMQAKKATGQTLEKANLEEKRRREENPNAIGYIYLMNFGQITGYYVIKGKVSSNGSQATPEDDIIWTCKASYGCNPLSVDGPQDDGSYGQGDPGIFFFLADGTKVVTSLDYIQTDRPIPALNVPKLGG
jgi:hypothetical protein